MKITAKQKGLEKSVEDVKAAIAKYEADHPGIRDAITAAENAIKDANNAREDAATYERQVVGRFLRAARIRDDKGKWHAAFVAGVEAAIGFKYARRDELRRSQYGTDPVEEAMDAVENRLIGANAECKQARAMSARAYERSRAASNAHYEICAELHRLDRRLEAFERDLKNYLDERKAAEDLKKDEDHVKSLKNEEERKAELREARSKVEALQAGKLKVEW